MVTYPMSSRGIDASDIKENYPWLEQEHHLYVACLMEVGARPKEVTPHLVAYTMADIREAMKWGNHVDEWWIRFTGPSHTPMLGLYAYEFRRRFSTWLAENDDEI